MPFQWKHLHSNVFDVWVGNGWDNWSRVRIGRDYAAVLQGNRIPTGTMKEIVNSING